MADQRKLFGDGTAARPSHLRDYELLPDRVWPTSVSMLHQGGDLLFHRRADAVKLVTPMHDRMFKRLVRLGEPCVHCGNAPDTNVQLLVTTGVEGVDHDRLFAWYDHMHNAETLRLAEAREIPMRVSDWFVAREGRR